MVSDKLLHKVASAEGVKTGMMAVLYVLTLYTCIKGQGFHCAATNAVFPVLKALAFRYHHIHGKESSKQCY